MALNKSLKCIFLGFGSHAQKYADAFNELDIQITSILVRKKKNYNDHKKKYKRENIYNNLRQILEKEKKYDFVMVMLPWNIIEKKIFQIIKFSKCKYIFSEKPIALSEEKLIEIIHNVNLNKKKLYILYNRRSYSIFNYVKKLLKKHKLKKFSMQISEKKQALIKRHTGKMLGNIRYHLTSHWIDLVMWLLNVYRFELKKINKSYQLISIKNHKININYFGNRPINMDLEFAGFKLKVLTLEKLYLVKKGKRKLILNEYKVNKFKPGIMLASKNIKRYVSLKKKNNLIPNINELKNLYQTLNLLEI